MIDVTYVISTHPKYLKPLQRLLASMEYIPNNRKIVVVADSIPAIDILHDITFISVDHNSFDFTGLIGIVERNIPTTDHIFPLHDTMELGLQTNTLIQQANEYHYATAVAGGQCNLMLLRRDYLNAMTPYLLNERNASKARAIQTEGHLWRSLNNNRGHYINEIQIQGLHKPYGDSERLREYYTGVDLVKWKANYGQSSNAFILTP